MRRFAMAAALLLTMMVPALAQYPGEWVLGQYQGGRYWFPGIVAASGNGKVTIRYDDGTRETLSPERVRLYDWKAGSRIECRWKNGGDWYAGRVVFLDKATLHIKYDDGDFEKTSTGRCRSN